MGANVSNQAISATTEIINNSLNKVTAEVANRTSAFSQIVQSINFGGDVISVTDCKVRISQTANNQLSALMSTNTNLANNVLNDARNSLENELKQELTQLNSGLNIPPQANINNMVSEVSNYITNNFSTYLTTSINNVVESSNKINQSITVNPKYFICKNGTWDISQDAVIRSIANNISTQMVDNAITNTSLNSVKNAIDQKASQTNQGIDISFGVIGIIAVVIIGILIWKFGTDFFTNWVIVVPVIIVIVILVALYFVLKTVLIPDAAK